MNETFLLLLDFDKWLSYFGICLLWSVFLNVYYKSFLSSIDKSIPSYWLIILPHALIYIKRLLLLLILLFHQTSSIQSVWLSAKVQKLTSEYCSLEYKSSLKIKKIIFNNRFKTKDIVWVSQPHSFFFHVLYSNNSSIHPQPHYQCFQSQDLIF